MDKLEQLKEVMSEMNDFASENYKKDITPMIIAEYKSLFMLYVKLYSEILDEGGDEPEFEHVSTMSDDEWEEMLDWTQKVVSICESSMTDDEIEGKYLMN